MVASHQPRMEDLGCSTNLVILLPYARSNKQQSTSPGKQIYVTSGLRRTQAPSAYLQYVAIYISYSSPAMANTVTSITAMTRTPTPPIVRTIPLRGDISTFNLPFPLQNICIASSRVVLWWVFLPMSWCASKVGDQKAPVQWASPEQGDDGSPWLPGIWYVPSDQLDNAF